MTPEEKAKELINTFTNIKGNSFFSNECALIVVNEMIKNGNLEPQIKRHIGNVEPDIIHLEYWFKVKKEINKL